jgi:hypothetical protein
MSRAAGAFNEIPRFFSGLYWQEHSETYFGSGEFQEKMGKDMVRKGKNQPICQSTWDSLKCSREWYR